MNIMRPLKLTTCKTTVKRTNLHLRELFTFNILSRLLTRSVCGVHGGERDADAGGAEEGDGELGEVGDDLHVMPFADKADVSQEGETIVCKIMEIRCS